MSRPDRPGATAMSQWERLLRILAALTLVVGLYFVVPVDFGRGLGVLGRALVAVLLLVALTAIVVWQVRRQVANPEQLIDGLVLALVVGVLAFALSFYVLEQRRPGEMSGLSTRLDALYFAMSTLLTIGYGDVHAVGQMARGLALVQMLFDVVVIASAGSVLTRTMRQAAALRIARRAEERRVHQQSTPDTPPQTTR